MHSFLSSFPPSPNSGLPHSILLAFLSTFHAIDSTPPPLTESCIDGDCNNVCSSMSSCYRGLCVGHYAELFEPFNYRDENKENRENEPQLINNHFFLSRFSRVLPVNSLIHDDSSFLSWHSLLGLAVAAALPALAIDKHADAWERMKKLEKKRLEFLENDWQLQHGEFDLSSVGNSVGAGRALLTEQVKLFADMLHSSAYDKAANKCTCKKTGNHPLGPLFDSDPAVPSSSSSSFPTPAPAAPGCLLFAIRSLWGSRFFMSILYPLMTHCSVEIRLLAMKIAFKFYLIAFKSPRCVCYSQLQQRHQWANKEAAYEGTEGEREGPQAGPPVYCLHTLASEARDFLVYHQSQRTAIAFDGASLTGGSVRASGLTKVWSGLKKTLGKKDIDKHNKRMNEEKADLAASAANGHSCLNSLIDSLAEQIACVERMANKAQQERIDEIIILCFQQKFDYILQPPRSSVSLTGGLATRRATLARRRLSSLATSPGAFATAGNGYFVTQQELSSHEVIQLLDCALQLAAGRVCLDTPAALLDGSAPLGPLVDFFQQRFVYEELLGPILQAIELIPSQAIQCHGLRNLFSGLLSHGNLTPPAFLRAPHWRVLLMRILRAAPSAAGAHGQTASTAHENKTKDISSSRAHSIDNNDHVHRLSDTPPVSRLSLTEGPAAPAAASQRASGLTVADLMAAIDTDELASLVYSIFKLVHWHAFLHDSSSGYQRFLVQTIRAAQLFYIRGAPSEELAQPLVAAVKAEAPANEEASLSRSSHDYSASAPFFLLSGSGSGGGQSSHSLYSDFVYHLFSNCLQSFKQNLATVRSHVHSYKHLLQLLVFHTTLLSASIIDFESASGPGDQGAESAAVSSLSPGLMSRSQSQARSPTGTLSGIHERAGDREYSGSRNSMHFTQDDGSRDLGGSVNAHTMIARAGGQSKALAAAVARAANGGSVSAGGVVVDLADEPSNDRVSSRSSSDSSFPSAPSSFRLFAPYFTGPVRVLRPRERRLLIDVHSVFFSLSLNPATFSEQFFPSLDTRELALMKFIVRVVEWTGEMGRMLEVPTAFESTHARRTRLMQTMMEYQNFIRSKQSRALFEGLSGFLAQDINYRRLKPLIKARDGQEWARENLFVSHSLAQAAHGHANPGGANGGPHASGPARDASLFFNVHSVASGEFYLFGQPTAVLLIMTPLTIIASEPIFIADAATTSSSSSSSSAGAKGAYVHYLNLQSASPVVAAAAYESRSADDHSPKRGSIIMAAGQGQAAAKIINLSSNYPGAPFIYPTASLTPPGHDLPAFFAFLQQHTAIIEIVEDAGPAVGRHCLWLGCGSDHRQFMLWAESLHWALGRRRVAYQGTMGRDRK